MFNLNHNELYTALGVGAPVHHWSAFDVPRKEAREGKAMQFVATVWNQHSEMDGRKRVPTGLALRRDRRDGSLWYMVSRPWVDARRTHVAHWNGIELALLHAVPMTAVLRDVETGLCWQSALFDIVEVRYQAYHGAMWRRLLPRGAFPCATRAISLDEVLAGKSAATR